MKYTLKFYIFKFDLNVKNTTLIFSNKNHGQQKKTLYRKKNRFFFSIDYVKIIELHVVHT